MRILTRLLFVIFILLAGCAQKENTPVTDETGAVCPLPLPTVYSADIPCSDCPPTRASLTLRPDSLYFLRITSVNIESGLKESKAEIGIWKYVSSGNTILLATYDNVARTLRVTPNNNLRVVKVSGGIIPPNVNYDLIRDENKPSYDDVVSIKGMYSYMGDSGLFSECLTGTTFPVAKGFENAALERAYMNTPHGQAEPILVNLEARLISLPGEEKGRDEEAIVPERFINIQPGIACSGEKSSRLRVVDNTWRLIEMDGKAIKLEEGQRNPFVHLQTKNNQIKGFAGCNRFSGTYLVKGEIFLFNKMSGSRMACVSGMKLEDEFFNVLSSTQGYRIEGDLLELLDQNGKILAKLQHAGGT